MVYKQLVVYASRRHRLEPEDAKQVAQEALRRFFDPEYADWDPEKYPTILRFLGSIVNGIVSDMRKRARFASDRSVEALPESTLLHRVPSPEDRVLDAALGRQAVSMLLENAQGDRVVEDVCLQMLEGNDGAASQASALGLPIRTVYEARRRLESMRMKVRVALGGDR
jgi:hypothetical protein